MSSNNPYQPPAVDVALPPEPLPAAPAPYSARMLRGMAWLSLAYLLLAIEIMTIAFLPEFQSGAVQRVIEGGSILLPLYLVRVFVRYVEYRYETTRLLRPFYLLALLSLAVGAIGLFAGPERAGLYTLIALPFLGGVTIWFGQRLRQLRDRNRRVGTLGWLSIAEGIGLASVVFAVLAALLALVWQIVLALFFFEAARELAASGDEHDRREAGG